MALNTSVKIVKDFLKTYGAEGGFQYIKDLFETVVNPNNIDQTKTCNKFSWIGYKVKTSNIGDIILQGNTEIRIAGKCFSWDNYDVSVYITPTLSGFPTGSTIRGINYGVGPTNKNFLNYKEYHAKYNQTYDQLEIYCHEGSSVSFDEIRFEFGSIMLEINDTINNSKYSYYNLFTKDTYSLALRDYYIKSFKNYNNADINLGTYTENAYNYNFNTIHLYVTQAPTLVTVSDSNISNLINNPWNDIVPNVPPSMDTNWKIYLDGTKMPNLKIVWNNKEIENKKKIENTRIHISFAEVDPELPDTLRTDDFIKNTEILPYENGNYKISFKDFYDKCGNGEYDEGISSILPKKSGWLILSIDYYSNITEVLPACSSQKMCVRILPTGNLIGYYGVWSDKSDNSTIKIIKNGVDIDTGEEVGDSSEDDGYTDENDHEENDLQDGQNNSLGVLTTTYKMTRDRLNQLGAFLWGANVFDEFSLINSNPIENIVSCKNIPMDLSGTDGIITIGNVDTGVNGAKISNNFGEIAIGSITIPTKYNSFLDFAPYTKLTIYLPYIGFKELDVTLLMGKTITIKYVVDVITGGCLAEIYVSSTRMYEFSGQVGVDIPITASNRAQVEGAYISNAVGMGASLASGNIQGVASSLVSGAMTKYSYSSTDKPNANCVASANRTCFVIIDRPTYQNLKSFNHTKGRMCNLSKKIGNLKGFTICDKNIDLSGIVATEAEKEELTNILSSGFFA